jgi:iron(III) transport system permease protein
MLGKSLAFATVGATIGTVAGCVLAMALPGKGMWAKVALVLSCLPLLVPSSLMGVGWIMAMGRDAVVTNWTRGVTGWEPPNVYWWPVGAGVTGLRYFGVAAVMAWAGRGGARTAVERAFGLPWWVRWQLRFGAMRTAAVSAWLEVLLLVHADHILPGLFLIPTFGTQVLVQYNALMDPEGAAALAVVPAFIAVAIAAACGRMVGERWTAAARAEEETGSRVVAWLVLALAVGIPLVGLVVRTKEARSLWVAWQESRGEQVHSLWLAAVGGALAVMAAMPMANEWVKARRAGKVTWVPGVILNLAVPGSLLALALIKMGVLRRGEEALVWGYVARYAPVAVVGLFAGWMRASENGEGAARVHGVRGRDRWVKVLWPARGSAVVGAVFLVGLLVAADLEISVLLVRPGVTTLGVRLYTLIHTAPDQVVSALAVDVLVMVVGAAALGLVALKLAKRGARV